MDKISVNGREFDVLCLLGKGKGGYSYLVTDGINQYTVKQIHHEPCDYYQFGNKLESELKDYETDFDTLIEYKDLWGQEVAQPKIVIENIKINLSTGDIELENLTAKNIELKVTTGDVELNNIKLGYLDTMRSFNKFIGAMNIIAYINILEN